MNPKIKLFVRKCQFPLTLALGFFPLILTVNGIFASGLVNLCWIFPAIYAAMAIVCMALPGKLRVWIGLVGVALLCLPTVFLPGPGLRWVALGEGLFYGLILLCSLPMAKWTEVDELSVGLMWLGMGLQLLAQVLSLVCKVYELPQMDTAGPWLVASLLLYVLLAMLAMNRRGLYSASAGRQAVPGVMRQKNLVMLLLLFAGAAVLAAMPIVGELVRKGFALLISLIMALILATEPNPGEVVETQPLPSTTMPGLIDGLPEGSGNPIASKILEIFAYLALVAAIIGLLYFIGTRLKKWLPRFWSRLSRHYNSSTEDYIDEITSTREPGAMGKVRKNGEKRTSRLRQRSLPPRQQIRSRYQTILQKHPEWAAGSTAREKLPASVSPLYERARYSDHAVTEEEARKFREDTKKI